MSLEAGIPGEKRTQEAWQMICCRYYTAGQLVSGKQVLEIGCGSGRGLGYLSARAQRVVGGDYSRDNLECARSHYEDRANLLVMDAQELPFKDNSFDVIVVMEVIQYLTRPDSFLNEAHRILRHDGILCLCLPNIDSPSFSASPLGYRYYSAPELSTLLNRNHFDTELFGAFPLARGATWECIRSKIILAGGRILDITPGGKKVKTILNENILGQNIVTKLELDDSDMTGEGCQLLPIAPDLPDHIHKILYAIAHPKKLP